VREEVELLKDHPDIAAQSIDVYLLGANFDAINDDFAASYGLEVVNAAEERALARAARAADDDDLFTLYGEVDSPQHVQPVEPLVDVDEVYKCQLSGPRSVLARLPEVVEHKRSPLSGSIATDALYLPVPHYVNARWREVDRLPPRTYNGPRSHPNWAASSVNAERRSFLDPAGEPDAAMLEGAFAPTGGGGSTCGF